MADTEQFVREDWEAREIALDDEDVAAIRDIQREEKYVDPDHAPWNDGEGSVSPRGE
jgi:2,5-diketo-D-gluconate reductase B